MISDSLRTEDFDFELPEELIASRPLERRDASRMMVVDARAGTISHHHFREFGEFAQGSLVVLNNTRVARARFFSDDGKIEMLRLDVRGPLLWRCMVKPGRKMRVGDSVVLGGATGVVEEILEPNGERLIRFDQPVDEARHGHLALPHYMNRDDDALDAERYQTVFADAGQERAIAAPTAGLHFTPELLASLPHAFITLHVGVGTFQPVRADLLRDHVMHVESYEISPSAATAIQLADRVLAVGTTVTRVLEHSMAVHGRIQAEAGETGIFITPGFQFRRVNSLLTNFHLPKSTLFMLVCAKAGRDLMLEAYRQAVSERYRFYSYGDCMLIR